MRKKSNKAIALLLAACMTFALTACGQTGGETQKGSSSGSSVPKESSGQASQSGSSQEEKEPVVLEWYYRGNGQQKDTDEVEARVNELLKSYPGLEHVSINIDCFISSEYSQQVALTQASGGQMDIVNSVSLNLTEQLENGTWMPIEDYISEDLKNELPDWLWEMGTWDGHIYLVPNYQNAFNTAYWFTPKEYLDKYGDYDALYAALSDASVSFKDKAAVLEDYVKKIREGEGDGKYLGGFGLNSTSGNLGFAHITPFDNLGDNFQIVDGTTEVAYSYEQPYWREWWEIYADWYDKGLNSPDGATTDGNNYAFEHMMDPISSVCCHKEQIGSPERAAEIYTNSWGFEVVAIPVQQYNFIQNTWGAGGNGVSSTCQHPEEAVKFLECITTGTEIGKEIYNTLVFGLEGKHYNFVGGDDPDRIETIEYAASQGGADTSYAGLKWIIGNSFYAYKNQAVLDDQYTVAKELNESPDTVSSSFIGFTVSKEKVATQVEQLNAVVTEYTTALNTGVLGKAGWEAYADEFMNKLKEAGLDEVKAEYQRQLDEWLAANR